jgi:ACS family hexuronate transporter-like MFS transporter
MTPSNSRPWVVCGLLLLATMLNYMDRQALAVSLPTLKQHHHLAEGRIGILEGAFGFSFAAGSLLFGFLADRWGPRVLYPLVLAGWSLAGVATSFAGQPWVTTLCEAPGDEPGAGLFRWLLGCRIVLGVFEAGHWPCALLTVRALLTANHRPLGNGILQSGASLGAIVVPQYIGATERAGLSWEFPFWSIGVAGLAWVPLWFVGVGRTELTTPKEEAGPTPPEADRRALVAKLVVLAAVVGTITISWQFLRAWLVLFLQDHHGYPKEAARWITSGYFVAADVGCLLAGVLVSGLTARGWAVHPARRLGFALFTLLTACGAVVPFVGDGWLMIALLLTAGAGILGLHPYYYSLAQEVSARRMGLLSGLLAAGGWVVSSLFQMNIGQRIQAEKSYQLGLLIVGTAPVLGLLAVWLLWPAGRRQR